MDPPIQSNLNQEERFTRRRTADEAFSTLTTWECRWRGRQRFLESKGYMLRPRYHTDWTPSWRTNTVDLFDCEDAIRAPARENLMDAMRMSDDTLVYIKRVRTGDEESRIAAMLYSEGLRQDPRNHSVPVLDLFQDDEDPDISYMIMPFLRLIDQPSFDLVEELIEFIDQILEGLVFMHARGVAHRDCTYKNLMMDASAMYPQGSHPVNQRFLPDAITPARPLARTSVPVRYYFVDYGLSVYIPPDVHPKLVVGVDGRDQEVPELSDDVPYNPFKADIYIIGNLLRRTFYDQYSNVDFLAPLFEPMIQHDPHARPAAAEVYQQWLSIRSTVSGLKRRWRLRSRSELLPETVFYSLYTAIRAALHFRGYVVAACVFIAAVHSGVRR